MPVEAADLKAQGNAEYGKRNYRKALELYTTLIETLKASDAVDAEQLSIAYRNRSAANVALYRFAPGLHDSIMSYNTLPTNNWKACLRAALCFCRTADLASAYIWIARAKEHAPTTPSDPVAAKAIQDMEDSIARKREFMSGGRFATLKLSEVLDKLLDMIKSNYANFNDFPYLAYRLRTILRAHYSNISPDCEAFDIKIDAAAEPASQLQAMQVAMQRMRTRGEYEITTLTDLCLRIDFYANHLTYRPGTMVPDTSRLKQLLRVPGCEDLFLSDLPDTTPFQTACYEGEITWERKHLIGEAEGPPPQRPSPHEVEAAVEDKAANVFAHLTMRVLEGLTAVRGGVIAQRAFHQLATIISRNVYRMTCDDCITNTLRIAFQNEERTGELAKGIAANGGLSGLCLDVAQVKWPPGLGFEQISLMNPLCYLTIDDYREIPVEEVADGVERLGFMVAHFLPETTCRECIQKCSKEAVGKIAHIYVRMYSAHGAKPFLMAARYSENINFYVSKMWPETSLFDSATAKSALDPGNSQVWFSLFTKWGSMHSGKQVFYTLRVALPSRKAKLLQDLRQTNWCDNAACDGSRAVFGDDGLRVLKLCGKCQNVAYCSRECQAEDWATRHKKQCAQLKGGRADCFCGDA